MAGSRIRGQKNQARALVTLDAASAEDFKISKAKNIERPGWRRAGFWLHHPAILIAGGNTHARKTEIAFLSSIHLIVFVALDFLLS